MSEHVVWQRRVSTWWWVRKPSYFLFVMRELSSLFVAWYVLFLLLARSVDRGEAAYADFLDWADSPVVVTINVVAFVFIVVHTVTWFSLTPQAMALRVGGRRVPGWLIIGVQYVALAAVSAFVWWLVVP